MNSTASGFAMLSQSVPELKSLPEPTLDKHDYSPIVKERVRLMSPRKHPPINVVRKAAGVKHPAEGYSYSKNQNDGWTITLDPQVFFGRVETCFHRPHRMIDWEAPRPRPTSQMAPICQSRCSSGHSEKTERRLPSPSPKVKTPPAESTKSVQEPNRAEKELHFMQQRFDAQKSDYRAAMTKLKSAHKEKLTTIEKEHNREILLLENTHSEITQTMHEEHDQEMSILEEKYAGQIKDMLSEVSSLQTKIQKMAYDHQTELNEQFLKMEESHEQKLEEYKTILHTQFETDFAERLAVRSNEVVGIYKKELLDRQQKHEDEILLLRRKFTKPSALIEEVEICQKQIAALSEEVKDLRGKLKESNEELRQSQVETAGLIEQLKKHQRHHEDSVLKVEQSFKDRLDMTYSENACLRLQAVKCQGDLGQLKVKELMRNRSARLDIRELLVQERRKKQTEA